MIASCCSLAGYQRLPFCFFITVWHHSLALRKHEWRWFDLRPWKGPCIILLASGQPSLINVQYSCLLFSHKFTQCDTFNRKETRHKMQFLIMQNPWPKNTNQGSEF